MRQKFRFISTLIVPIIYLLLHIYDRDDFDTNRPSFTRGWTNSEPCSQFHDYHLMRSHGTHETGQNQKQLTLEISV